MNAKRLLGICLGLILAVNTGFAVSAAAIEEAPAGEAVPGNTQGETAVPDGQQPEKPFLALGADLTPQQRAEVLALLGITETDLAACTVLTISNEQEHQYLDNYLSPSIIGTKSLSSVLVKQSDAGSGIVVTTKNISYCTTGMYRNALLTAGVKNADILVVGPVPISGTAGLIGALKAYEQMTGQAIPENTLDTALNELIITGELASAAGLADSEDAEALIAFVKAKLANGELKSEQDIREAIKEGEAKFGVSLSEDEILKIITVMNKIDKLGLDPGALLDQAKDLYNKFGDELLQNVDKAAEKMLSDAVHNFLKNFRKSMTDFFRGLFK